MADIMLKNYMEDCVLSMLPKVLENAEICKCERCQKDIMAFALNRLTPKYVVTEEGEVFAKLGAFSIQYEANVITAIGTGVKIVGENPRHD